MKYFYLKLISNQIRKIYGKEISNNIEIVSIILWKIMFLEWNWPEVHHVLGIRMNEYPWRMVYDLAIL